jgi:hypothetical protein
MTRTRRQYLALAGASLTAGCTDVLPFDSNSATRLGGIVFFNNTDQTRWIQLRLRRENENVDRGYEVVYEENVSLDAKQLDVRDMDWPQGAAEYTLLYSTPEELRMNRIPHDFDNLDEQKCNYIRVEFQEPEGLTVSVTSDAQGLDETPSC